MDLLQRRTWNQNHKRLTEIILKPDLHNESIELFLSQHKLLFSSKPELASNTTLEDALLTNLDEATFRKYPVTTPDTNNSIAWHYWHIARIEDMTMNILISDGEQALHEDKWLETMNIQFSHSGNNMNEGDIANLSLNINIDVLLAYRQAVGRRTEQVVKSLIPGQFKEKVSKKRIKRLFDENAVTQDASWLADYWSKKSIGGLILMPATRHNFLHLNKCIRIKEKLHKLDKKKLIK